MASFSEHEPKDIYALNTYGLLLERQKLYKTAIKQFTAALELSEDKKKDMISINLARILIQVEKYKEAVELCRKVKSGNFNFQCHLALALFKGAKTRNKNRNYVNIFAIR
jgi:superkiller protein 3